MNHSTFNYWIIRRSWIRIHLVPAILVAGAICVAVVAALAGAIEPWISSAIPVGLAFVLFVPLGGHTLFPEWPQVTVGFLRRRRRGFTAPEPAQDIETLSGTCGIRWEGETLVAAVEVAQAISLTEEAGGGPDGHGHRALNDSFIPVSMVAGFTRQYGLTFGIDIVSIGEHVPAGSTYRTVYGQIVGPGPLLAQRRTWLVMRLNVIDNLTALGTRGPARTAAPKALVTAAHRVVTRLREQQIAAHAATAAQLDTLGATLLAPAAGRRTVERWRTLVNENTFTTTYSTDPARLSDAQIDNWWSWRTEQTAVIIRLTPHDAQAVSVSSLVRYVTLGQVEQPRVDAIINHGAQQRSLFDATLPCGDRSLVAEMPTVSLSELEEVNIPIGPAGPIFGHRGSAMVAVSMIDYSAEPERRRIDVRLPLDVMHRIVLRSVVTGAVVAIHTEDQSRWDSLVSAVNDPSLLFYAAGGAKESDLAVFDDTPVTAVPTRTSVALYDPSSRQALDINAAMQIKQVSPSEVSIRVRRRELSTHKERFLDPVIVPFLRTPAEDRYLGQVDAAAARPRRQLAPDPAAARRPRRQERFEAPLAAPRRDSQPVPPVPTGPGDRRAGVGHSVAPVRVPEPTGNGNRDDHLASAGRRRDFKLAAPQARGARHQQQEPEPVAPRRRRDFKLPPPPDKPLR